METLFVALSLNVRRGVSEDIWPLRGFIMVLLVLANLHPDKVLLFLSLVKNVQRVLRIWGQNNGNQGRGN